MNGRNLHVILTNVSLKINLHKICNLQLFYRDRDVIMDKKQVRCTGMEVIYEQDRL